MSTAVFPTFIGLAYPVTRTPLWSNDIQTAISGRENRLAYWTYPKYQWEVELSVLQSNSIGDFQTMMGFYNLRQGQFDTFLYEDPDDFSATGQTLGIGNGSTAAFQLIKDFGNFIEPVLAPKAVTTITLGGIGIPTAGYSAPGAATLTQVASGSLGATTYYVKITWVTNSGETLPGTESSLSVSANNVLHVAQPASPPAGAVSWKVYVSNTAGGGSGAETLQATVAIGTTSWQEPTSGLVAGAALPVANTTGWTFSQWGTSTPGVITFAGNVANTVAVTATFTYYYPCRFTEDKLAFTLFVNQMYSVKKLTFQTVKN